MESLVIPSVITLCTIALLFILTFNVGNARSKYNIKVPKITGNVEFERVFRTQQNMLENTIMFLPVFWIASISFSEIISGIIGGIWLLSRTMYAFAYTSSNPKNRFYPFLASIICTTLLFILSVAGFFY